MAEPRSVNRTTWIWTLASIAVVVGALYLAKGVLLPLILAVLFSFLLSPICDWLERRGLPRVPAVLMSVIIMFAALGAVVATAATQLADLAPKIGKYQGHIESRVKSMNGFFHSTVRSWTRTTNTIEKEFSKPVSAPETFEPGEHPYAVRVIKSPPSPLELFAGMFGTVLEALASTGIVIVLVLFFVARREDLRDRFIRLMGQGQVTGTTHALEDASARVSRYLLMLLVVNVSFGAVAALGLHLIGVPNAMLWGILTATLKFVPYIGVWISAAAPFCLSLAISPNWVEPVLVLALYVVLEFFVGNFLEPMIFGHHTGVSAVAILVAAVFWSWLWGGIGLLLATPLTVCLLVLGKHVPQLAFLDILLGDEPVLDPPTRVYQRLLAGDLEEATEFVVDYRRKETLIRVFDGVLIPALCLAERDASRGDIDQDRLLSILDGMHSIIDELDEAPDSILPSPMESTEPRDADSPPLTAEPPRVFCIFATGQANDLVSIMISQVAQVHRFEVEMMSAATYQREFNRGPLDADLVCIFAMPPITVSQVRKLYRRSRLEFSDANLVFGLWDFKGDIDRARKRIACSDAARITTTLEAAFESVLQKAPAEPAVEVAVEAKPVAAAMM